MDRAEDQLRELRDAAFQGRRFKVRARLLSKQDHKCWVCSKPLTALAFDDDPHRPAVVQIDRSKPKDTANSVVICGKCSGSQGNFPSLMAFKEAYDADPTIVNKKKKDNPVYPETVPLINRLMAEQCTTFVPLLPNSYYRFTPTDKVDQIIPYLVSRETNRQIEAERKERIKSIRRSNTNEEIVLLGSVNRIRYSERQNHRCCYCGNRMTEFSNSENGTRRHHPLCATWEHIIPVRDGGPDTDSNLVIACSMCNSWREELRMTAMEYFEWAQTHKKEVQERLRWRLDRFYRYKWRDQWRQQYLDLMGVSA